MAETFDTPVRSGASARGRGGVGPMVTPWKLFLAGLLIAAVGNAYFVYKFLYDPGYFFPLVHRTYDFNTILLPVVLLILGAAGLLRRRSAMGVRFGKAACALLSLSAIGLAGLRVYATHIEPYRLQVRTLRLDSPKLKTPLRIVHVSDIQSPAVGEYEKRVFALVRALEPDLVLHTGDLLQPLPPATPHSEEPKMAALWESLAPPLGKFNVPGDTEHWVPASAWDSIGGLRMLEGREVVLEHAGTRIRIFGLPLDESRDPLAARKMVEPWFRETSPEDYTILMGHSPEYVLGIYDLPIDLCLAGHTHGGQIRLPFIGPLITSSYLPKSASVGFHTIESTRINISAGIGSEHALGIPSIRINCPPEMTVIEVQHGGQTPFSAIEDR